MGGEIGCTCNMTFEADRRVWIHHSTCPHRFYNPVLTPFVPIPSKEEDARRQDARMKKAQELFARPASKPLVKKALALIGIGGGPTRATTIPDEPVERKKYPIATGLLDYFPDALAAVAHLSWKANEQHNPGQPVHWARGKSTDHDDTLQRHFLQRGTLDTDGIRHRTKVAWRALAALQEEIEEAQKQAESSKERAA